MTNRVLIATAALCSGAAIAGGELLTARLLLPAAGGGPGVFLPVLFFFALVFPVGAEFSRWVGASSRRYRVLLLVTVVSTLLPFIVGDPLRSLIDAPLPIAVLVALTISLGPALLLLSMTVPLLAPLVGGGIAAAVSNTGALAGLVIGAFGEALLPISSVRLLLAAIGVAGALLVALLLAERATAQARPRHLGGWPSLFVPAAIASAALGATSTLLTADLGGIPFLWALPLAAYFLAWMIAFAGARWLVALRLACDHLAPVGAAVMIAGAIAPQRWPYELTIPLLTGALLVVATALLGRVADRMPADRAGVASGWRTVGIGGACGAALAALAAPALLVEPVEIAIVGWAAIVLFIASPHRARRPQPALAIFSICSLVVAGSAQGERAALLAFALATVPLLLFARHYPRVAIASGTVAAIVAITTGSGIPAEWRGRSLFGPVAVIVDRQYGPAGETSTRALISGRTVHGTEIIEPSGYEREPTTYYNRRGPAGELVALTTGRIGIVGLGAGSMAAYASADRPIDFVDIDAMVIEIARSRFGYLRAAGEFVSVTEGEGRRWIEESGPARYRLLVIDAFNGDAIPTHLLTVEAMRAAGRALQGDGLLAYHVSNRSFALAPAIATTARSAGLDARRVIYGPDPEVSPLLYLQSEWVVVGTPSALARLSPRWQTVAEPGPLLTDERSDLLAMLRR